MVHPLFSFASQGLGLQVGWPHLAFEWVLEIWVLIPMLVWQGLYLQSHLISPEETFYHEKQESEGPWCSFNYKMFTVPPPLAFCWDIRNSPGWPQIQDLPESASQLLRLWVCTAILSFPLLQILLLPLLTYFLVSTLAYSSTHVKTEDNFLESFLAFCHVGPRDADSGC